MQLIGVFKVKKQSYWRFINLMNGNIVGIPKDSLNDCEMKARKTARAYFFGE